MILKNLLCIIYFNETIFPLTKTSVFIFFSLQVKEKKINYFLIFVENKILGEKEKKNLTIKFLLT